MPEMFWNRDPAHNTVKVKGVASPGRARISMASIPYNWDIQEGYGLSGASMTFKGRGLVKFTLYIDLWAPEHFIAWQLWMVLIRPPSTSVPLVVEMGHPVLSMLDVKAVAVLSLGQPERQSNGMWTVRIDCIEYREQQKSLVKPRGSIPSPEKGAVVTPQTEADRALVAVRAELEKARGGGP